MTTAAPLIGLTAYGERAAFGVWDVDAVLLPRNYVDMVVAAGGTPVLLPSVPAAAVAVDALDGLVITGGPDLDPETYGAQRHARTGMARTERDDAEFAMLRRALARGIPVLGVCRGLQVLNVALGGTLTQHLPDVIGHDGHNPSPGVFGPTTITLDPTGRVGTVLGATVDTLCHHHQAIDRLAEGLVVTGRAADGTIEAVELTGHRFVVGVQWHPEQSHPWPPHPGPPNPGSPQPEQSRPGQHTNHQNPEQPHPGQSHPGQHVDHQHQGTSQPGRRQAAQPSVDSRLFAALVTAATNPNSPPVPGAR